VPTATARARPDASKFAVTAVALSLGFFGLLRLNWIEAHVLLPFTRGQAALAVGLFGAAPSIDVTLACSGADALALCLGAILAYPVEWPRRLAGAAAGLALVVTLNIARIGTLGWAAASPAWFNMLHVYVWPAVLTLAIAGYVFTWMRVSDSPPPPSPSPSPSASAWQVSPAATARQALALQPSRRFIVFTLAFLLVFAAASPLYLESARVLALAGFIARAAAWILGGLGVNARAADNVLWTSRGGFTVTQECISTPLIPVYLAAVCAYAPTWRRLVPGVLAALPLFIALGIVRLLVVALPDAVMASPTFFVHAFYQLLLGAVVVCGAALWRHGGKAAFGYALAGLAVGVLFVRVLGPFYTPMAIYPAIAPVVDTQGAIAFLPAFQVGLFLALWVAAYASVEWRRFVAGLLVLGLTQTALLLALHALAGHTSLTARVSDIRAWAVAGPLLIAAMVTNVARTRR
jgi:exosortase/archaeosortase family protein